MDIEGPPWLPPAAAAAAPSSGGELHSRQADGPPEGNEQFISQFVVENTNTYMTSDWGAGIDDAISEKAGIRGPTALEDVILRQKLQHFDHERIPERVVHARGAGVYGSFTSYADWSNITAASFLSVAGKVTPTFVRFSTVIGERGSTDTARDVHGFATRFYTDEGNYDIVGINVPVFFINDGILFPDLIHALKPQPNNAIPQAATAHDTAYDFFSQTPSSLNLVMLAMAGYGIPRSYRHMDGWGVHTFRFVTDDGSSKLVRYTWSSMQGKASYLWEEAQVAGGKNSDTHRQDLYDAIEAGIYPEWELGVQIVDEDDQLAYGFDLLDDTKILPPEMVPITWLGKMTLNQNPLNYFAETEQVSFLPSNVVRGIEFSNDPVLQARLYSYMDTQLNRFNGPNFNQAPTNRPRNGIPHNNNRDGYAQGYIHANIAAYKPNTLGGNFPMEANQTTGDGFFTAPNRTVQGMLTRTVSTTFNNFYMQPNMVWSSLTAPERQILVNALRFETSRLTSNIVKQNFITQLNYISHDLAVRVAQVLEGVTVPPQVTTYYTNFTTSLVPIFSNPLPTIRGLSVGILASIHDTASMTQAAELAQEFTTLGVFANVVAETLIAGVNFTYSAADASFFDGIIVVQGAESIFSANSSSSLYPLHRPAQIINSGFNWGKPIAAVGSAVSVLTSNGISTLRAGVYTSSSLSTIVSDFKQGLLTFKFLDRFPLDPPATN
ncbi:hypothetical protein MRS44_018497 [Fusarium solani]|uniref:uncharacterized protein n=1 Tax=Fusarium solani TaxID=169388 RepID=UPI0032C40041|nr:hypothetical protein MRS44_018497 [Fusarium solani]